MHGLCKAGIELNRKVISELAIHEPESFKELVAKARLPSRPKGPFCLRRGERSQAIVAETETRISNLSSRSDWEQAKAVILGPNGNLTKAAKQIGNLSKEERPAFGQAINQTKKKLRHSSNPPWMK